MLGKLVTKRYTAGPSLEETALCCYRPCERFVSKIHHHPWTDVPANKPRPALAGGTASSTRTVPAFKKNQLWCTSIKRYKLSIAEHHVPARSNIACSNTLHPASMCSGLASSISLWLMPSLQGMKIMPLGASLAM